MGDDRPDLERVVVGDAFELELVIESHGLSQPTIDDNFVRVADLVAAPDKMILHSEVRARREQLAAFGPDGSSVTALDGGVALLSPHVDPILPECCGDLGDLGSWQALADLEGEAWREIWIGHPVLLARRAGPDLWIAVNQEPGGEMTPQHGPILVVSPEALRERLAPIGAILEEAVPAFEAAIGDLIRSPEDRRLAARALLGLPMYGDA